MSKSQSLKKRLIKLYKDNWNFTSDDIDIDSLAEEMMEALGSTDSDLRQKLAYRGFYELINNERVSEEKCRLLFLKLINEQIVHGLGRECDDSLGGRTWSVLVVPGFFEYNDKMGRKILSDDDIRSGFNAMLRCLNEERDLRYYVDDKGIGHGICHYTELFPYLVADSAIGKGEVENLMDALKRRICIDYQSYFTYEYVTFADATIGVLNKEVVSETEFADWISSFLAYEKTSDADKDELLWENRSKFFWCLEEQLNEKYPHLQVYVWDAIFNLMDKAQPLKVKLFELAKGGWVFPDALDASALADEMKEAAASTDYELRDMLALIGFKKLVSNGKLNDEKCRSLLSELTGENHLLKGIGEENGDYVYSRAWSACAIAEIVSYSQTMTGRFLDNDTVRGVFGLLLKCAKEEKDLRPLGDCKGYKITAYYRYVEAIGRVMKDDAIGYDEIVAALAIFKERIFAGHPACFQRFPWPAAQVMSAILEKGIVGEKEIIEWLSGFLTIEKTGDTLKDYWHYKNKSNFLWLTLYFTPEKFEDKYPNFHSYVRNGALGMMEVNDY